MDGRKKAEYLEKRVRRLEAENKSLREENRQLTARISDYEEQISVYESDIEMIRKHVSEAEASYAEEIEMAHEARLAYLEARASLEDIKKKYKNEFQIVISNAKRTLR